MNDQEIIDLYWTREESAITATAEKYGSYCHAIAYRILYNNQDAEECTNDTYLGAWNSMPPRRPNRLSTYLGKITRNLALNRYKRYTAEKRGGGQVESVLSELEDCIPAAGSVEQAAEEEVLVSVINRFLQAQPSEKRNIFIRRYWHLWAVRNIADAYGMSESKVTSMLFRMRGELRRCLEQEDIVL
ncbi:RNA polymerase subunit sigma-70 [Lachnospiraceae bacterium oral taxon 500]|nr:RNA polymerase subunit sigma-70 [Lachnospiraceae bacterium oral taxon 500]